MNLLLALNTIIEAHVRESDEEMPKVQAPIYPEGFFDPQQYADAFVFLIEVRKALRETYRVRKE